MSNRPSRIILRAAGLETTGWMFSVGSLPSIWKHTSLIRVPVPAERWIVKDLAPSGAVNRTISLAELEIV